MSMAMNLVHEHLPLETLLRTREHRVQRAFAYEALEALGPQPEGIVYEPSHEGLRIYARDEVVLAKVTEVIQRRVMRHGELQWPRVRYRFAKGMEEPVMGVLLEGPEPLFDAIKAELDRRQAEMLEASGMPGIFVVRARGPLRRLMGLPAKCDQASNGFVKLQMWLSHYQPLTLHPDPQAA